MYYKLEVYCSSLRVVRVQQLGGILLILEVEMYAKY